MINKNMLCCIVLFFCFAVNAMGQVKKGVTVCTYAGSIQKFADLKKVPQQRKGKAHNEEEEKSEVKEQKMKMAIANELTKKNSFPVNNKAMLAESQQQRPGNVQSTLDAGLCLQFTGSLMPIPNYFFPADVSLAAGFEHLVQMTNNHVAIFSKTGTQISSNSLNGFWSPLNVTNAFDPKIVYDHFANRWIAITPYNARTANSAIGVAVSQNHDPTGGWSYYFVKADPNSNEWFDYPSVGFTTDKIVFSGNMLFNTGNNTESKTYVLDKAAFYNGTPPSSINTFAISISDAVRNVHPSINFDNNATSYCIEQSVGSGKNSLYTIIGSASAPIWTYMGEIDFSSMGFMSGVADAPQRDTSALLDMGDSKVLGCILRNGHLYFTNPVSNNSPLQTGVDVAYINASSLTGGFKLRWMSSPEYFGYPNITVNKNGEVLGSVGRFSATTYASSGYIYWNPGTQVNYIGTVKNGEGHVAARDSRGRNRWGDYSGASLDPSDEESAWISSDYGRVNNGGVGAYNTSIAKICPPCPDIRTITTSVANGQLKKFTGNNITANSTLANGSIVKMQAANSVTLTPGFVAESGVNAKIFIAPCEAEVLINQ
jgi:hypothetical protein